MIVILCNPQTRILLGVPHAATLTDHDGATRDVRIAVLGPATKQDYLDHCKREGASIADMDEVDRSAFYFASVD